MSKMTNKIAAALTAGVVAGQSAIAHAEGAQTDLTSVSNNIVTSTQGLPTLISTAAYIGGIGLGVAGVFKLKQHVDNPGQHPLKDGMVRLGAGGGLLALPFLTKAMQGSLSQSDNGGTAATYQSVNDFANQIPANGAAAAGG